MRGHPRQGPAEEIPVFHLAVFRLPDRAVVPVLMDPPVPHEPRRVRNVQPAIAVWEDLIRHALAKPGGGMRFLVNGELPGDNLPLAAVPGFVQETAGAVVPPEAEPVPHQLRRLKGKKGEGEAGPVLLKAGEGHFRLHLVPGKLPPDDDGAVGESLPGEGTAGKGPSLSAGKGAVGLLALSVAGVKDGRCVHGKKLLVR